MMVMKREDSQIFQKHQFTKWNSKIYLIVELLLSESITEAQSNMVYT